MSLINGFVIRAATIPISIILGMFILAFIPEKENIFTIIGKNSIIILIFHRYFIIFFEKIINVLNINMHTVAGILLLIITSMGITLFLSIDVFYKLYKKIMETIQKIIIKE
jgi:fucose 4-O-acetylase-like acetyltransferase